MAESIAWSYNGTNTLTATITGATNGDTYGMWSDQGTSTDSDVAAGGVANLSIGIAALAAGFGVDVFVQHGAPFSNTPYIGTTRFCYGSTSECCFDATWSFDGHDRVCVTFTLPVLGGGGEYFLQIYDQGDSGVSAINFKATGAPQTICMIAGANPAIIGFVNGAHVVNSTTIDISSTTFFPSSGELFIDGEFITYTGKTASAFTGCSAHAAYVGGERVVYVNPALANGVNAVNSATLNVNSTAGYAASGTIYMSGVYFTHTGKTATSFTGCGNHPATVGGEPITIPLLGGIVAQLSTQADVETWSTRLFTQELANDGYPGVPRCFLPQIYRRL